MRRTKIYIVEDVTCAANKVIEQHNATETDWP